MKILTPRAREVEVTCSASRKVVNMVVIIVININPYDTIKVVSEGVLVADFKTKQYARYTFQTCRNMATVVSVASIADSKENAMKLKR
jgi:hypothetical protein